MKIYQVHDFVEIADLNWRYKMAFYKQPCIHCGTFIEADSKVCISCSSMSPFGYSCPTCGRQIQKGQNLCSGCGRSLYIHCPSCDNQTFVQDKCEFCNTSLMIRCENIRCGTLQFFQNTKCTACGKKLR